MAFSIRRIVTGHNEQGRAIVAMDNVIASRPGRFDDGTHVQLWFARHLCLFCRRTFCRQEVPRPHA